MKITILGVTATVDTSAARDRLSTASIEREVNRMIKAEERAEQVKARREEIAREMDLRRAMVQDALAARRAALNAAKTDIEINAVLKAGDAA
jgi:hypothetical protein